MGELARYRRGRDLHLSRGHLMAGMVGVMLLSSTSFAIGHHLGSRGGSQTAAGGFTAAAPQEGLVELLARVESSGDTTGGVESLTFPDALTRSSGGTLLDLDPVPSGTYQIEVGRYQDVADARALRAFLRERELEAWVGAELEAGVMTWRVAVGGYLDRESADEGLTGLSETLGGWSGGTVQPRIVSP